MRVRVLICAIATALAISGCALPNTSVRSGSVRPTLIIRGAPDLAVLYVDGLLAGKASEFDGVAKTLIVEEGPHQVEIRLGDVALHNEKIYVSSGETRVVNIGGLR